ncbi:CBS domain-containing protein [Celerinatantimonas yamalensis]|uniref:CBS domain-containing protein n=1 Tax=Celerinatantimonas yamalensis TaxID=559956 RepID=A0ABW9G340_9GAMM
MSLLVRDYLLEQSIIFHPQQSLAQVVELLVKNQQIGAPVCDDQSHLLGWVSEQDCLSKILKDAYHCESISLVDDVMRTDVLTVEPTMSVIELAQMMCDHKPKMYPVVENGQLIGMITRREVLHAMSDQLASCFVHK